MRKIAALAATILLPLSVVAPADAASCGDATRVRFASTEEHGGEGDDKSRLMSRFWFRQCSSGGDSYLEIFRIQGKSNVSRGDDCDLGPVKEALRTRHTFTTSEGQSRTIYVPCDDSDSRNSEKSRVSMKIWAQDPCPVSPCPAATTVTVKHTLEIRGENDPSSSKRFFVS